MSYIMINEVYLLSVDYLTFRDEEKSQSHDLLTEKEVMLIGLVTMCLCNSVLTMRVII